VKKKKTNKLVPMFLNLYGISKSRFQRLIDHYHNDGISPRIHSNNKRLPHNALPLTVAEEFFFFLFFFLLQYYIFYVQFYKKLKSLTSLSRLTNYKVQYQSTLLTTLITTMIKCEIVFHYIKLIVKKSKSYFCLN